jgi:type II secretory pathway pseudopilin PulG
MTRRSARWVRSARSRRLASSGRPGFSLLEILFAVVCMSIAMMGMAGMLVVGARTTTQISARSARGAVQLQLMNRLATLPYDSLDSQAGCATVSAQPFQHTSCIALTNVSGGSGAKAIRLIVTPLTAIIKPDTTYLTRSNGTVNPLAL